VGRQAAGSPGGFFALRGFQRLHVDHEAVLHIAFFHALVSFVDVFHVEHFHVAGDVMLGTEIQYFLLCRFVFERVRTKFGFDSFFQS
jgi:hypothetical protein